MTKEELDISNGVMGLKFNDDNVVIYQKSSITYEPALTLTASQFLLLCEMIPFVDREALNERMSKLQTLS